MAQQYRCTAVCRLSVYTRAHLVDETPLLDEPRVLSSGDDLAAPLADPSCSVQRVVLRWIFQTLALAVFPLVQSALRYVLLVAVPRHIRHRVAPFAAERYSAYCALVVDIQR